MRTINVFGIVIRFRPIITKTLWRRKDGAECECDMTIAQIGNADTRGRWVIAASAQVAPVDREIRKIKMAVDPEWGVVGDQLSCLGVLCIDGTVIVLSPGTGKAMTDQPLATGTAGSRCFSGSPSQRRVAHRLWITQGAASVMQDSATSLACPKVLSLQVL